MKIPLLDRKDIGKKARPYCNEVRKAGDTTLLYHDVYTNGIGYLRFLFDLKQVPEELFPYVGLLQVMIGLVDTKSVPTASCTMRLICRRAVLCLQ